MASALHQPNDARHLADQRSASAQRLGVARQQLVSALLARRPGNHQGQTRQAVVEFKNRPKPGVNGPKTQEVTK